MLADAALLAGVTLVLVGIALTPLGLPAAIIVGGIGSILLGLWLGVTKPTDRKSR